MSVNVAMALRDSLYSAVVMTKPKEKDGLTRYHVYRRVSARVDILGVAVLTWLHSRYLWIYLH